MTAQMIPWARPDYWGREKDFVLQALNSTWISGGPFVGRLEQDLARYHGRLHALTASSGTAALQLAFLALGLKAGDEVIVPGFGFLAAANMAHQMGAKPVFVDVDPAAWCMRAEDIEPQLSSRTKVIAAVHTYGNVCAMDKIMALARRKKIAVVEDASESLGSRYKGKLSGSFGTMGVLSFQATKTITTGEGGMVLTDDQKLAETMSLFRSHGLKRKKHYWHECAGFNFRLTNMQAALGCAQFKKLAKIIRGRGHVHQEYKKHLADMDGLSLQFFSKDVEPVLWAMAVKLDPGAYPQGRDKVLKQMMKAGIETRPGFYTAHAMQHLYPAPALPVSEALSARIISLPTFASLTKQEIKYICKTLIKLRR